MSSKRKISNPSTHNHNNHNQPNNNNNNNHEPYDELIERKSAIKIRLEELRRSNNAFIHNHRSSSQRPPKPFHDIYPNKDTHWDYLMKEMMWLSADFISERSRQRSLAKKCAMSIRQYHKHRESRRARQEVLEAAKKRKLAAKIAREVKQWWGKVDRIVAYKQRMEMNQMKQRAMDKHLVFLVKQTEKYSDTLRASASATYSQRRREDHVVAADESFLSIEEALAMSDAGSGVRRKKGARKTYINVTDDEQSLVSDMSKQPELYGYFSDCSDDGDDDCEFIPSSSDEGEHSSSSSLMSDQDDYRNSFEDVQAVNEEIKMLCAEANMPIDDMLRSISNSDVNEKSTVARNKPSRTTGRTTSTTSHPYKTRRRGRIEEEEEEERKEATVDDSDNSQEINSDSSGEFVFHNELDDETTLIAEEALGNKEFSSHVEEIRLLQEDNEVPIEHLREKYAKIEVLHTHEDENDRIGNVSEINENKESKSDLSRSVYFSDDDQGSDDDDGSAEFKANPSDLVDDETTLIAEERLGREQTYEEELAQLTAEQNIPLEQLRAKYLKIDENSEFGEVEELSDDGSGEFQMDSSDLIDDETTLIAEERLGREQTYEEELAELTAEQDIPIEQLRTMYMNVDVNETSETRPMKNVDHAGDRSISSASSGDEEYVGIEEVDDETTMIEEEKLGREITYKEELDALQKENEMSIKELKAHYSLADNSTDNSGDFERNELRRKRRKIEKKNDSNQTEEQMSSNELLQALQRSDTIARKTVATRPFLLSPWVKLREYQQIGLNWLVSMQSRRLNGILADEMGLGKTLQTISLLSYLACYKGIWGPHLIIVPTSCIVNWEMELKRFCPALKVLCYYGSAKRRKELRTGWTKTNVYHVVITSYQLVVQDSFAYKRKKWYYMILDEAQNIKNFQSQRWQTLINFNTQRRLLLTGTPLQNNLMELWSLLHFLMPHVFRSRKEFSYWFNNPMSNIIDGTANRNNDLITRLHGIIRPFVLRRLKRDVEKQLPGKFEHIVKCSLSRRQMFLYEEFMARSSTRLALSGQSGSGAGNMMSLMNVLMQLRKVCNHPDLFEPRSIVTPFTMDRLVFSIPLTVLLKKKLDTWFTVSHSKISPLWSSGEGLPCGLAVTKYDPVTIKQIRSLYTSFKSTEEMKKYCSSVPREVEETYPSGKYISRVLHTLQQSEEEYKISRAKFESMINAERCSRSLAFPYYSRVLRLISFKVNVFDDRQETKSVLDDMETPTDLLKLRKTHQQKANELDSVLERFVFCVPTAKAGPIDFNIRIRDDNDKLNDSDIMEVASKYLKPFHKANFRLSSFFPDKKLVQFDAGKLQVLAVLLRRLKEGGHRALIFTQMSRMLDILEAFLNIHGHTYLRLDGSTGVDKRQRMMDRFNNDPKIFCFILSTRSGGLGINLTGADTVIFYDSDWNPAMDAQAQDRAHRIGQTRDVHIYRLVTQHTIEENILKKAKQKQNLDLLVMNEGNFDASFIAEGSDQSKSTDVFTNDSLREILVGKSDQKGECSLPPVGSTSKIDVENIMASLEDADDVKAMRGARKEAKDELVEFDENVQFKIDEESSQADESIDNDNGSQTSSKSKKASHNLEAGKQTGRITPLEEVEEEREMEKEFAAWQVKIGVNADTIGSTLCPTERYGLNFRETIDPYYSLYYLTELDGLRQAEESERDWNIDEIEESKIIEERKAMDDGDLLATYPSPTKLIKHRHLYRREKVRLKADKKRRKLTGEDWSVRRSGADLLSFSFWFNSDTGEVRLSTPKIVADLEAESLAREKNWNFLPLKALNFVMMFLIPFPERMSCSLVCKHWGRAAKDISFVRHVIPVEQGALLENTRLEHNHFRTVYDAMDIALPGDTIELSDGHYWLNHGLVVNKPIRIVGDEQNPGNVVFELSGTISWKARRGLIEGVTIRRPRINSKSISSNDDSEKGIILDVKESCKLDLSQCVLNNESGNGSVVKLRNKSKSEWKEVMISGAQGHGIDMVGGAHEILMLNCDIGNNTRAGINVKNDTSQSTTVCLNNCRLIGNGEGGLRREGSEENVIFNVIDSVFESLSK